MRGRERKQGNFGAEEWELMTTKGPTWGSRVRERFLGRRGEVDRASEYRCLYSVREHGACPVKGGA